MKDFFKTFFILLSSGFLFNGCASSIVSVHELMDTPAELNSAPIIDASLGVVMFDYVPKDEYEGEAWRQAFKLRLNRSNIFSPNTTRRINVVIQKLDLTHDNYAATFDAEVQGTYSASSVKNDFFYETTVVSKGRSDWNESFETGVRKALAINRAVANNFIEFIRRFKTYVKTKTQAVAKSDQDYQEDSTVPQGE
jgi:hypothetical protein